MDKIQPGTESPLDFSCRREPGTSSPTSDESGVGSRETSPDHLAESLKLSRPSLSITPVHKPAEFSLPSQDYQKQMLDAASAQTAYLSALINQQQSMANPETPSVPVIPPAPLLANPYQLLQQQMMLSRNLAAAAAAAGGSPGPAALGLSPPPMNPFLLHASPSTSAGIVGTPPAIPAPLADLSSRFEAASTSSLSSPSVVMNGSAFPKFNPQKMNRLATPEKLVSDEEGMLNALRRLGSPKAIAMMRELLKKYPDTEEDRILEQEHRHRENEMMKRLFEEQRLKEENEDDPNYKKKNRRGAKPKTETPSVDLESLNDDEKKYQMKRVKNNIAAKRSRDSRREKELHTTHKANFYENDNCHLRKFIRKLMLDNCNLKQNIHTLNERLEMGPGPIKSPSTIRPMQPL